MKQSHIKEGATEEVRALLNRLKDSDWWARKDTIRKLLDYPETFYISDLEQWLRKGEDALLRNAAMETFRELGPRALISLSSLLKDEDVDVRIFAANVLGDIKCPASLEELLGALHDPEDNVRIASAEALGKIGDARAVGPLAGLFEDMPWTALAAIEALGQIGGNDALSALYTCLEIENYRAMACDAIGKSGDMVSIGHLAAFLEREDAGPVLKAIVSIAEREKTELPPSLFSGNVDMLIDCLASPQDEMRMAAFIALSWSRDMRGLPYFLQGMQDDLLVEQAIKGLLALGKKAAPAIIETMKKPGKNKGTLAKVLAMMEEKNSLLFFADDEDDEVRTEVALAIGQLKTHESVKALQTLRRDPAEEVREAALLSLRNFEREVQHP